MEVATIPALYNCDSSVTSAPILNYTMQFVPVLPRLFLPDNRGGLKRLG